MNNEIKRKQMGQLEIFGKLYPIYEGLNLIGRDSKAIARLPDVKFSKQHAIITVVNEDLHFISDFGSSNGSRLGSIKLTPYSLYKLKDNAIITLSDVVGIYRKHISTPYDKTQTKSSVLFNKDTKSQFDNHDLPTQVISNTQNVYKESNCGAYSQDKVSNDRGNSVHEAPTQSFANIHEAPTQQLIALDDKKDQTENNNLHEVPTQIIDIKINSDKDKQKIQNDTIHDAETQKVDQILPLDADSINTTKTRSDQQYIYSEVYPDNDFYDDVLCNETFRQSFVNDVTSSSAYGIVVDETLVNDKNVSVTMESDIEPNKNENHVGKINKSVSENERKSHDNKQNIDANDSDINIEDNVNLESREKNYTNEVFSKQTIIENSDSETDVEDDILLEINKRENTNQPFFSDITKMSDQYISSKTDVASTIEDSGSETDMEENLLSEIGTNKNDGNDSPISTANNKVLIAKENNTKKTCKPSDSETDLVDNINITKPNIPNEKKKTITVPSVYNNDETSKNIQICPPEIEFNDSEEEVDLLSPEKYPGSNTKNISGNSEIENANHNFAIQTQRISTNKNSTQKLNATQYEEIDSLAPTQFLCENTQNNKRSDEIDDLAPTQKLVPIDQNDDTDDHFLAPTQKLLLDETQAEDIFEAPTQKNYLNKPDFVAPTIPEKHPGTNTKNISTNSEIDNTNHNFAISTQKLSANEDLTQKLNARQYEELDSLAPTQLLCENTQNNKRNDEIDDLAPTQKLVSIDENDDTDDLFLAPTQKLILNETQAEDIIEAPKQRTLRNKPHFVAPTIPAVKNTSNKRTHEEIEDDVFLAPTQKLCLDDDFFSVPTQKISTSVSGKQKENKKTTSNKNFQEEDGVDFLAPTQKLCLDDDVFSAPTQKLGTSLSEKQKENKETTNNKTLQDQEDEHFLAPTQKLDLDEDVFSVPTQKLGTLFSEKRTQGNKKFSNSRTLQKEDDEHFLAPTQKLCLDDISSASTQKLGSLFYGKQKQTKKQTTNNKTLQDEEDEHFLAPTQKLCLDDDVLLVPTQKLDISITGKKKQTVNFDDVPTQKLVLDNTTNKKPDKNIYENDSDLSEQHEVCIDSCEELSMKLVLSETNDSIHFSEKVEIPKNSTETNSEQSENPVANNISDTNQDTKTQEPETQLEVEFALTTQKYYIEQETSRPNNPLANMFSAVETQTTETETQNTIQETLPDTMNTENCNTDINNQEIIKDSVTPEPEPLSKKRSCEDVSETPVKKQKKDSSNILTLPDTSDKEDTFATRRSNKKSKVTNYKGMLKTEKGQEDTPSKLAINIKEKRTTRGKSKLNGAENTLEVKSTSEETNIVSVEKEGKDQEAVLCGRRTTRGKTKLTVEGSVKTATSSKTAKQTRGKTKQPSTRKTISKDSKGKDGDDVQEVITIEPCTSDESNSCSSVERNIRKKVLKMEYADESEIVSSGSSNMFNIKKTKKPLKIYDYSDDENSNKNLISSTFTNTTNTPNTRRMKTEPLNVTIKNSDTSSTILTARKSENRPKIEDYSDDENSNQTVSNTTSNTPNTRRKKSESLTLKIANSSETIASSSSILNTRRTKNPPKIEYSDDENSNKNELLNPTVSNTSLNTPSTRRKKPDSLNVTIENSLLTFNNIVKPKVVFTMFNDPRAETAVRTLGGRVVDEVQTCTAVVTNKISRSLKFLSAIGLGKPIVGPNWITESQKQKKFQDPWEYLLYDQESEKKLNFSLKESFKRSIRKKLLTGYTILLVVHKNVDVLKEIIECCGGKCITRAPSKNSDSKVIVVSYEEDKSKYSRYLKLKTPLTVVAAEAIFSGVLTQELNFQNHLLTT